MLTVDLREEHMANRARHDISLSRPSCYRTCQIMTPAGDSLPNAVNRNFLSALSHIERAAGVAGATVTVHDASKPAHVRLSRGVLVAQARRAQIAYSGSRGCPNGAMVAAGGPAALNMVGRR